MGSLLDIARTAAAANSAPASEKAQVSPDQAEGALDISHFEERAAIREFDGGAAGCRAAGAC